MGKFDIYDKVFIPSSNKTGIIKSKVLSTLSNTQYIYNVEIGDINKLYYENDIISLVYIREDKFKELLDE